MFSKRIVTISRLLIVYRLGQNSYLPLYVSMPLNDRYGEKIKYCLFFFMYGLNEFDECDDDGEGY